MLLVPAHRHLDHPFPALQGGDLPGHLVLQRQLDGLEGVEVLHLDLGAELLLADRPHTDVGLAAHRAFLHVGCADAQVAQDLLELDQVGARFFGRANVRLGDDLQQRHAGTVQVDEGHRAAAFAQAGSGHSLDRVYQLAGILLQVGPRDPNSLNLNLSLILNLNLDPPVPAERQLILADLVAFGQVGVVVILAGEQSVFGDGAVQRQPGQDRLLHGRAVDHRQHARQRHAYRANMRVGRRGRVVSAASAEHFGLRLKLGVDFQADDGFVGDHGILSGRI